jgi:hypothetical protein
MSQSPEPIDYTAVLGDLESKRSALDAAITAIRQVLAVGANVSAAGSVVARHVDPENLPSDVFFGLSVGEAAKKYLGLVKRKQTTRDIAEALERGGLPHTSTNFLNTVTTMLSRQARVDSELVKVGREWGLSGWYGNRRPSQTKATRKPKRKARGRRPLAPKPNGSDANDGGDE